VGAKEEKVLKIQHGDPGAKSPASGGHGNLGEKPPAAEALGVKSPTAEEILQF